MGQLLNDVKAMRELLSDPAHWMQHSYSNGMGLFSDSIWDDHSTSFCFVGSIYKTVDLRLGYGGEMSQRQRIADLVLFFRVMGTGDISLVRWNDDPTRTHSDVLDLLDRAIAQLERGILEHMMELPCAEPSRTASTTPPKPWSYMPDVLASTTSP